MARAINSHHTDAVEELLHGRGPHAHASDLLADIGALADRLGGGGLGLRGLGLDAFAPRVGTEGPDTLLGGDGPDLIDARGGDDRAAGGGGDDVVAGGGGDDFLAGDGGLALPAGNLATPIGDDTVIGGSGNDTLFGDAFFSVSLEVGSNLLFGGAGDDSITGGYGADTVYGGSGDDYIQGWGARAVGASPGGTEALRGRDLPDLLLGGAGNDTIDGSGGGDTIDGGAGDDRLVGGVGIDTLTGGPGADRFVFAREQIFFTPDTGQGEGNRDVVTDFRTGVDLLDFTGYGPRDLNVRWDYDEAGDRTIVTYEDPRGAAFFPNLQIELTGVRDLSESDFAFQAATTTADALA